MKMLSSALVALIVGGLCTVEGHPNGLDAKYLSLLDGRASGFVRKLSDVLHTNKDKLVVIVNEAVDALMVVTERFHAKLGLLSMSGVTQFTKAVDQIVTMQQEQHQTVLSEFWRDSRKLITSPAAAEYFSELVAMITKQLNNGQFSSDKFIFAGNRVLSEQLQSVSKAISNAVSPFKEVTAELGDTLKEHFSHLVDAIKRHDSAFQANLSRHVEKLKAGLTDDKSALKMLEENIFNSFHL